MRQIQAYSESRRIVRGKYGAPSTARELPSKCTLTDLPDTFHTMHYWPKCFSELGESLKPPRNVPFCALLHGLAPLSIRHCVQQ